MTAPTKPCSKCDIPKPLDAFYTRHGVPYSQCKDCHKLAVKRSHGRRAERSATARGKYDEVEPRPPSLQEILHRCGSTGGAP